METVDAEDHGNHWRRHKPGASARKLAARIFVGLFCLFCIPVAWASDSIETAGDILQILLPASAGGLTLGLQDYTGTLQFGESFALTTGVTYGLKYTVNETRPNGGSQSFPSGHTSASFCAAEFMRKRYGWEIGVPYYAAASFVAYSRVESKNHWPHDVIAGAAIGIVSSYIFTRPYKGWNVQLEGDSQYIGFSVTHVW
jgi:membrane-associated phospholipid phosphatase